MRVRSKAHAVAVASIVGFPILGIFGFYLAGYRWARTPSLPPGIYRMTQAPADPLVSFCPDGAVSKESTERNYREEAWTCPDGHAPLLKPIAARPGDTVTVTPQAIYVNGKQLPNSQSFAFDRQHLPMHPMTPGTYQVKPHTFWVISTYNKASYDSRYYGAIDEKLVISHAHPTLQWR